MKLKTTLTVLLGLGIALATSAQNNVGIGTTTPEASAVLDVSSTTQGMLIPRMTAAQRIAITGTGSSNPATGLLVYQTDAPAGFWYYNGSAWVNLSASSGGASELEKITEGGNTGWRILGRNPLNYGNIGSEAIDLSYSSSASPIVGATGQGSFAVGNNIRASGDYSTAMGSGSIASGANSSAIGQSAWASGLQSSAMGFNTKASALGTTALGFSTTASGNYSTSMGVTTIASGASSTAMGNNTKAIASNSTATGSFTTANGVNSTAMGYATIAKSTSETVIGQFNDTLTTTTTYWAGDANNRVFTVGTGIGTTSRASAFTVLQNGAVRVGPNGSYDKNVYTATAALGTSATQKQTFTITTGKTFTGSFIITATVVNEPGTSYTDAFSVTIANITATTFDAVVYRLDGTSWGQTPVLSYTITTQ